jgi:hypothetical protein
MIAGMYEPWPSEPAAFVPRRAGSWESDLDQQAIFFHEYAHHLQLQYATVAIPAWAVEGFAEFFATAHFDKDGIIVGTPPQYRAYGLFRPGGLSIEEMVGVTSKRMSDSERDQMYGYGWLLMHYLTFEPKRKGQLTKYVDGIQQGMSALESAKAAFGDLRQLQFEIDSYKQRRLEAIKVPVSKLRIGPISIRPLTPGEAAIMPVHIRSRHGVNSKTAPGVAVDARAIAAAYPKDAFVQACLAEAEIDADNYAAAEAAADRALAVDPKLVRALIYKGRARMEMAHKDPAKANWEDIRSWFLKANKLDTENAEPLALYYETFTAAGQKPTKNAVAALLYAADLAPQTERLRLLAAHELLAEDRVAEAKKLFAPLAFNPHASAEWRDKAATVMAAMDAGDSKKALAALEASTQKPPEPAAAK